MVGLGVFLVLLSSSVAFAEFDFANSSEPVSNRTVDSTNCLHACLDECMQWQNLSMTSDDCLIPCAVYVEEFERTVMDMDDTQAKFCNGTAESSSSVTEKPDQINIRMSRKTSSNVTEIWWNRLPGQVSYHVEIWCKDSNDLESMQFEDETYLTWYAFRQCAERCPGGYRARVACRNQFGIGDYSTFTDRFEETKNSTFIASLLTPDRLSD